MIIARSSSSPGMVFHFTPKIYRCVEDHLEKLIRVYEDVKILDKFVKSLKRHLSVIPAKAGIQEY